MRSADASFFDRNLFFLVHLKGLLTHRFAGKYYGQWGEDIILNQLFARQARGIYVDVGAYHPFHYSNTYLLYKKGWRGINIDPNPHSITLFKWHRPRDINLNCGVAGEEIVRPYFIFNHQSCNTFSLAQKEAMLQRRFIKLVGRVDTRCYPLNRLLGGHLAGKRIDLLNIDTEGMSGEALRSLDWERFRPGVICVEDEGFRLGLPGGRESKIYSFLTGRGYELYAKTGLSCVYRLPEK